VAAARANHPAQLTMINTTSPLSFNVPDSLTQNVSDLYSEHGIIIGKLP
jgi:hypothetical protein